MMKRNLCKEPRRNVSLWMLAVLALVMVVYAYCPGRGVKMIETYITPMVAFFLGMHLLGGRLHRRMDYWIGLCVPVWYVLTRMLHGDLYLNHSYLYFSHILYPYALALPFALFADDEQRRSGLKTVAAILFVALGCIAWVGVAAAVLDTEITLPFLGTVIQIDPREKRLMMGIHYNATAAFLLCALLLGTWYTCTLRKRWFVPIAVFLDIGLFIAIGFTASRTVMLQFAFAIACAALFAILRPAPKKPLRIMAAALAFVLCVAAVYGVFQLTVRAVNILPEASAETLKEQTVAVRSMEMEELLSLNGRSDVYLGILRLIGDHPQLLLRGLMNEELFELCPQYTPVSHSHNSYLHILMLAGIPGLLAALWLTVRVLRAAVRVAFVKIQQSSASDKAIAVMTVSLLIGSITEVFLFMDYLPQYNMIFLLLTGYLLEIEHRLFPKK